MSVTKTILLHMSYTMPVPMRKRKLEKDKQGTQNYESDRANSLELLFGQSVGLFGTAS